MSERTDLTDVSYQELKSMFWDLEEENERMAIKLTGFWNDLVCFWSDIRRLRGDNQTWGQYWDKKKAEALEEENQMNCIWKEEKDVDSCYTYSTSCDNMFEFNNGNTKDNGFKCCPYCGHNIKENKK